MPANMRRMVKTTTYKGKAIVEIDFGGCVPGTYAPRIQAAQATITAAPKGTVLALTRFGDARFDPGTVVEMERFVSAVMPHLKANALLGITGMKKVVFNGVKMLYRVPVELFDDEAAAREWLSAR
jgi:hypothetical protein